MRTRRLSSEERQRRLEDGLRRVNDTRTRFHPVLAQVLDMGAMPTSAGKYFALAPVTPGGAEVEGGAASNTTGSGNFFAVGLGSHLPSAGDLVVAKEVGGRWAFQRGSASGSCQPCATPANGSDNETVTWTFQSGLDSFNQLNGQTLYWFGDCGRLVNNLSFVIGQCYSPLSYTDPSGRVNHDTILYCDFDTFENGLLGPLDLICGETIDTYSGLFSNPLTFNLSYGGTPPSVKSQVIQLCSFVRNGNAWADAHPGGGANYGENCSGVGNFSAGTPLGGAIPQTTQTWNVYAQVRKSCGPMGTTYALSSIGILVYSLTAPYLPPTDLRNLRLPPFVDPSVIIFPGPTDSFTFPPSGAGVTSCSPLLMSASHNVVTNNCGLAQLNSTNSITVAGS